MNNTPEIDKYLLGEMEDEKRQEREDRLFADDEYFFELVETENGWADRYASGELKGTDAARFETAMEGNPNLGLKVANARILGDFIRSERAEKKLETVETIGIWDRVRNVFRVSPVPAFAFGSALIIIAAACGFLLVENGRRNAEIARLETELSNARPSSREAELASELSDSKARETGLQNQIDEERDVSGDLASDLAREREHRRRLERDIATLKKPGTADTARPGEETVSVLRLDADSATADVPQLNAEGSPERVSLLISVSPTLPVSERVSIRLNGREIARNVAIRQNGPAGRQVNAVINTRQLAAGQNVVTVHDASGKEVSSYKFQGGEVE